MSIVAMSETVGSRGTEIGRSLAATLGWEFADREIITKAAESFGEGVSELTHATEEKPTLWDRFRESQQRYATYVEATVLEMAARDMLRAGQMGLLELVLLADVYDHGAVGAGLEEVVDRARVHFLDALLDLTDDLAARGHLAQTP